MLSAPEKKEKDQFFRDLDRIEDLDNDDGDVTNMTLPDLSPARSSSKPSMASPIEGTADLTSTTRRKRKQADVGLDQEEAPHPRLARASTLPEQEPQPKVPPRRPRLARSHTVPEKRPVESKAHELTFTDLSNLEKRLKGTEWPKLRPLPKSCKVADIPVDKQIFQGLVFFFVPNNDDDVSARMRIHGAIKYGATWAHEFSSLVTHIFVTRDEIDATTAAKSFHGKKIPEGPFFLHYRWLWESWKSGLQPISSTRFQVPGFEILPSIDQAVVVSATNTKDHVGDIGNNSEPIEVAGNTKRHDYSGPAVMQPKTDHPAKSFDDALENAIRDVQTGEALDDTPEASGSEDDSESGLGFTAEGSGAIATTSTSTKNAGFLCMESHDGTSKSLNPNALAIEKLQKMSDSYQTSNQFRAKAFRQAIGILRRQDQLIRTYQQARDVGIGDHVAQQVAEIVSTGRYKRLEFAQNDLKTQLVSLFTGVYGAGETTAHKWISQGYRSLDDVRQKANLTPNQLIGLEHYDDFQQRIPRDEVAQHGAVVKDALKTADPKMQLVIGGSYRRGSKDSGDIDCIIFMEDADIFHIRTLMLDTVIPKLMGEGFLKVALASGHSSRDDSSKWHGASTLPGSVVWRRIDFLFVPWNELGAALIYFTGNDLFNRSIKLLAGRKGMRLNQHGLCKDVMRGPQRQRINDGTVVESHDENRIFEILGVPYRPPEERNA